MPKKPRPVYIDESNAWFLMIRYADRRKYQRHSPAQFDIRWITREQVVQWIKDRPDKFVLVAKPKEPPCPK